MKKVRMLISTYKAMFYMYEKVEGSERISDRSVEAIIPNEIKPQTYAFQKEIVNKM